jgi:hypothetical protein
MKISWKIETKGHAKSSNHLESNELKYSESKILTNGNVKEVTERIQTSGK